MSLGTARSHVRVARALESLPVVAGAFAAGELSFSKVRALTRLAQPFDEAEMVETARWATASQLDRLVAGCRRAMSDGSQEVGGQAAQRFRRRDRGDGEVEIVLVVSEVDAERIENEVASVADRSVTDRDRGISVADRVEHLGGWDEIRAQAATDLLTGSVDADGPDPTQLVVEVDAVHRSEEGDAVVAGQCAASGRYLPNQVIRRLGCDALIAVQTSPGADVGSGRPTDAIGVGLSQRVVPGWLRRQLERRDAHRCQFPGCASHRRLHAHHIIHWLDNGPTDLDNLILLCSFHHHLMHEGGWSIEGPVGSHRFLRPDGSPALVPQLTGDAQRVARTGHGAQKHGTDAHPESSLVSLWDGQPLDLHFAVAVIATNLAIPRDRPAG